MDLTCLEEIPLSQCIILCMCCWTWFTKTVLKFCIYSNEVQNAYRYFCNMFGICIKVVLVSENELGSIPPFLEEFMKSWLYFLLNF